MQTTEVVSRGNGSSLAARLMSFLLPSRLVRPRQAVQQFHFWVPDRLTFQNREDLRTLPDSPTQLRSSGRRWSLVRRSLASLTPDMESVRKKMWFVESRFSGEVSPHESFGAAGISRYYFALDATIRAWRKRIFKLSREMLVVERRRQLDDVEQRANAGAPGNPIEVYSPIFRWLCGRD
jgi:hypothetical protein